MAIEDIIRSIKENKFRVTDHADEEASNDGISLREAFETIANGQIIEQYPDDKPFPSCLLFSKLKKGEPIHTVWAFNSATDSSVLITIYRPDPQRWIDGKIRRIP
ncbi:MAG: DUF4258 domain-containing protein [Deltaproteobacteria bacterium]|nr:DUF4258 domain-containing protein [Deltaproteobacteria bacterium]